MTTLSKKFGLSHLGFDYRDLGMVLDLRLGTRACQKSAAIKNDKKFIQKVFVAEIILKCNVPFPFSSSSS